MSDRPLGPRLDAWWWGAVVGVPLAVAWVDAAAAAVALVVLAGLALGRRATVAREIAAVDRVIEAMRSDQPPPPEDGRAAAIADAWTRREASLRRRSERLLHEVQRARELLEAAPDGIVVVGAGGAIELANGEARRLLAARRDPVGAVPIEVFPVAEVQECVDKALDGKPSGVIDALRDEVHLALDAHPVEGGVMLMVRDVTVVRHAERARTEFVANVSHELRTPIAAIMGFAETLATDPAVQDGDLRLMVDAVLRNARRLSGLFDDLLKLHRIESRRSPLPRAQVVVADVLAEAVATAADRGRTAALTVEVDCPPTLTAFTSREALSTITSNLVSNACKYTPAGGRVWARGRAEPDGSVVIEVQDTGVGIAPHHHERVFERFYRIDGGRGKVGGAGVGLAIVKHFAQAIGATVELSSAEGRGSTFRVRVPPSVPHRAPTWDATL